MAIAGQVRMATIGQIKLRKQVRVRLRNDASSGPQPLVEIGVISKACAGRASWYRVGDGLELR